jgi:hypothetical protein
VAGNKQPWPPAFKADSSRVRRIGAWALGACLSLPRPAAADQAKAESLFREGRRLLVEGHVAEACDRFAESQREEPSSGALLNLARCHGDAGMTATAWREYLAAARLARSQERPQQAAEAELRAQALESRLLRLVVELEPQSAGTVVTRNGERLAPSDLGVSIPVDPGSHVVRATAPGHSDWTVTLLLSQPGQVRRVTIPALTLLPRSIEVEPAHAQKLAASTAPTAKRTIGAPRGSRTRSDAVERPAIPAATWVAMGVGTATLVSTAVLAWVAKAKWDDAHERGLCDAAHACNREGLTQTDAARRLGNLATGSGAVSVAAFASAFLFYSFDGSSRGAAVQASVSLSPTSATFGLHGGL